MQALLTPLDDMKLREEDKVWLSSEIANRLATERANLIEPSRFNRVAQFLREWGVTGACVTGIIALLGITLGALYYSFSRVDKEARFQATTEGRLTGIEKSLHEINNQVAQQSITNHAALPLEDFKATLPNLSTALVTARKDNLLVPNTVIGQLHAKLSSTDSATPGFWPAAANLISIRSNQSRAEFSGASHFPDCADTTPEPTKIAKVDSPTQAEMQWSRYTNCVLTLDSTRDTDQVNAMMDTFIRVVFKHCIIVYRGGPIGLKLEWNGEKRNAFMGDKNNPQPLGKIVLTRQTVEFEDSTFEFTIPAAPPKSGQVATKMLLAQSGNTLVLPDPQFRITNPVDRN